MLCARQIEIGTKISINELSTTSPCGEARAKTIPTKAKIIKIV
jgi:hypothetical protein